MTRDLDVWVEALSPDIVLWSPILRAPFRGRDGAVELFGILFESIGDFQVTDEFASDGVHVFFWRAACGTRPIEGTDLVRTDEHGKISEIRVSIRPLVNIAVFAGGRWSRSGQQAWARARLRCPDAECAAQAILRARRRSRHPHDTAPVTRSMSATGNLWRAYRSALAPTSARPVFIQRAVFVISLALFAWSLAGLIANPDFATGAAATSKRVLGVEFNGLHAVSGFLLFGPGLLAARRADLSFIFAVGAAAVLAGSGVEVLLDRSTAGLWNFRHNQADAILHFGSAVAYGLAATGHVVGRRRSKLHTRRP